MTDGGGVAVPTVADGGSGGAIAKYHHYRQTYRDSYPQIFFALFFLATQFVFMSFEPIAQISSMHMRIREFIVGTSPACMDDEFSCVALSDVHSWETMAIWANQSLIKPVWGNYQGSSGMILQYLSLGEELVVWTRRARVSQGVESCPAYMRNFVTNCAIRHDEISTRAFEFEGALLEYDRSVNRELPLDSLYAQPDRQGFFYTNIPVNGTSMDEATSTWSRMSASGLFGVETEEVVLMFVVVSPKTHIISLVQVHFFMTDAATRVTWRVRIGGLLTTNRHWHMYCTYATADALHHRQPRGRHRPELQRVELLHRDGRRPRARPLRRRALPRAARLSARHRGDRDGRLRGRARPADARARRRGAEPPCRARVLRAQVGRLEPDS